MSRRPWILLGIAVALLLTLRHYNRQAPSKVEVAAEADAFVRQAGQRIRPWLQQDSIWLGPNPLSPAPGLWDRTDWPEGWAFFLHRSDSLHFWTDYQLPWPAKIVDSNTQVLLHPLHRPRLLFHRTLSAGWRLTAAIELPATLPIRPAQQLTLVSENWQERLDPKPHRPAFWQLTHLAGLALYFIFLMASLSGFARLIANKGYPFLAFLSAGLGFLIGYAYLPDGQYPALGVLQQLLRSPLSRWSIAHLLLLAPAALWGLSLAQHLFDKAALPFESPRWKWLFSIAAYLSITVGLLLTGAVFQQLLLYSGLPFDFNNVLELSTAEFTAMGAIVLLLLTLLLYSLWIARRVHQLQANRNHRLLSLGGALLLSLPLAWVLQLGVGWLPLLLLALLFVALLDLFVELEAASPAWLLLWLALLSAFSAGLLFKYNLDQGSERRHYYAQDITHPVDAEAEQSLERLSDQLRVAGGRVQLDSVLRYLPYLEKNYHWQWLSPQQQLQFEWPNLKGQVSLLPPNAHYYTYGVKAAWTDSLLAFRPRLQSTQRIIRQLVGQAPQQSERYSLTLFKDTTLIAQRGYFLREWT
ncbi:MAG TPA: hypothetical protein VJ933_11265, partial [Phaeodactylibacter sp.]|nr:hypothetical protein [Phaeodactylibacter sp.]